MKRFILLLFTLIYTISGFAQIEEMNEDEFLKKPVIKEVPKDYFFEPYNGQVSTTNKFWINQAINGDMYNVKYPTCFVDMRGKRLFSVFRRHKDNRTVKKQGILSSDEEASSFLYELFHPGNYYEFVEVLITKNEIDSLIMLLKNRHSFTIADNVRDSLWHWHKTEEAVTNQLLWDTGNRYGSKFKWPDILTEETELDYAIVVLRGQKDKRLYYIPYPTSYNNYGVELINMENFIFEEGVQRLKKKYEGKHVVDNYPMKECILQKIAMKNGELVCAITDTASMDVNYYPLFDERKRPYDYTTSNDSINVLGMADRRTWYCLKSDVDSIETAIEIRKLEEQRKNLQKDEQKKKMLVSKYGEKIANSIIKGKACVGMNTQMVEEVLGKTDSKIKRNSTLGTIEIWTYSFMHELYPLFYPITIVTFTNGKVSEVEEVK